MSIDAYRQRENSYMSWWKLNACSMNKWNLLNGNLTAYEIFKMKIDMPGPTNAWLSKVVCNAEIAHQNDQMTLMIGFSVLNWDVPLPMTFPYQSVQWWTQKGLILQGEGRSVVFLVCDTYQVFPHVICQRLFLCRLRSLLFLKNSTTKSRYKMT